MEADAAAATAAAAEAGQAAAAKRTALGKPTSPSRANGQAGRGASKKGAAPPQEGDSDAVDASEDGQSQQQLERSKSRVISLAREVAALTRERDSLLGIVLDAASQARAQGGSNSNGEVPLLLPTSLAQRLLGGGDLQQSDSSLHHLMTPKPPPSVSDSSRASGSVGNLYRPQVPRNLRQGSQEGLQVRRHNFAGRSGMLCAALFCREEWDFVCCRCFSGIDTNMRKDSYIN